jgi:hypothetical protein
LNVNKKTPTCDISPVTKASQDFPKAEQMDPPDPAQTPTDRMVEGAKLDFASWTEQTEIGQKRDA